MRYLALALVLGLPLPAAAQQQHQQQPSTLPSIGLPLPTIGLPLPAIGLPAQSTPALQPVPGMPRNEPVHPDFRPGSRPHHWPSPIYVYSPYPFGVTNPMQVSPYVTPPPPAAPPAPQPQAQPTTGRLRIDAELPGDIVQVFIDGAFAGTLEELEHELELKPGAWRIELRAQGYRSVTFMTQIIANRTITYRAVLERDPSIAPPAPQKPDAPPQVATGGRTIYFIPGCYLGNVPPVEVKLPAGCDLSKLRTSTP